MSSKPIPKYRKQKSSKGDRAFVELSGIRHYLGGFNTPESRGNYTRLLAEWEANGRRIDTKQDDISIIELTAAYWQFAQGYYIKNGVTTVELGKVKTAIRPLNNIYGELPVSEFGPLKLKTIRQTFIDKGLARSHINQQIAVIKRIFRWGVEQELLTPNVLQSLEAVVGLKQGRSQARETMRVKPVCDDHVNAVKPYVSRQVWGIIQLQLLTGMRSTEVCTMRAMDIDTRGKVWTYTPASHKTEHHGRDRVIDLGPKAQAIVKSFLNMDVDAFLFDPRDARIERHIEATMHRRPDQEPNPRKSNRKVGDHYTRDSYRRAIQRACNQADAEEKRDRNLPADSNRIIPRWFPHQLRHSAGTKFRKEFGLEAARVLLGHSSVGVTEIYSEIDRGKSRDVMMKIG